MILPLVLSLLLETPLVLSPTEAEPMVFRIPDPASETPLAEFEVCFGKVTSVRIVEIDGWGQPRIAVSLNDIGGAQLAEATTAHAGKTAEILLGDDILTRPIIQEPLLGGSFEVSGIETIARAEQLRQAVLGRCTALEAENE